LGFISIGLPVVSSEIIPSHESTVRVAIVLPAGKGFIILNVTFQSVGAENYDVKSHSN
jgi:hypothetical protein